MIGWGVGCVEGSSWCSDEWEPGESAGVILQSLHLVTTRSGNLVKVQEVYSSHCICRPRHSLSPAGVWRGGSCQVGAVMSGNW